MRSRIRLALRALLILVFLFSPFAMMSSALEKLSPNLQRALQSIQPFDAYAYCKIISSEKFAGRLTGHEGYTAAAKWAAAKFKQWGLKPFSAELGYLQPYPSPYVIVDKAEMTLFLKEKAGGSEPPAVKEIKLTLEKDFLPLLFTDRGERSGDLVFAGWGISAPELGYDDYAGLDVGGKFVLCFRGTPDQAEKKYELHDHHRRRMKTAKDKGALGIIYIYEDLASNPNGDWIEDFTPAMVTEKTADLVFQAKGLTSVELRKDLTAYKKPLSFPLEAKVFLHVESRSFPKGVGYNVVGYVEGSEARLKKECLIIGGHFDHNGTHMGLHFPGADDNASGSAAVMEIAEAFSKIGKKPRRSVVFALFGGEEKGLQGSTYFVDHLPPAFDKVETMFNFDMVGEGDATGCGYSAEFPELKAVLEEADQHVKTLRQTHLIQGVGVRGSDHAPFYLKGIPCLSFHSNGPHLHYHQTGDTIYRINPDIMADVARLAFVSAWLRANR